MKTIFDCTTVEELKEFGTLKAVREEFLRHTPGKGGFKLNTYKGMLEAVTYIREATKMAYCEMTGQPAPEYSSPFFKGKAEEYIYYLTQTYGELRRKGLRYNHMHFVDPDAAKHWYWEIAKIIHPDNCKHPLAAEAMNGLRDVYDNMAHYKK